MLKSIQVFKNEALIHESKTDNTSIVSFDFKNGGVLELRREYLGAAARMERVYFSPQAYDMIVPFNMPSSSAYREDVR